jgi:hypothetical protein
LIYDRYDRQVVNISRSTTGDIFVANYFNGVVKQLRTGMFDRGSQKIII